MSEDNDQKHGEERRSVLFSLISPNLLPAAVSVVIAFGSAFMYHDRSISELRERSEQRTRDVVEVEKKVAEMSAAVAQDLANVRHLEREINDLKDKVRNNERAIDRNHPK